MQTSLRPYSIAAVALVGAGVVAITPVAPPPTDVRVANPAVNLTAAIDPITPWQNVFAAAGANLDSLAEAWLDAPLPVVQQIIANQIGYLGQLPDLPAIARQIVHNLQAAVAAPLATDRGTLDLLHELTFNVLPAVLPIFAPDLPGIQPLLDFATTSLSGVLLGLVGPVIGPVLALAASTQAIVAEITAAEPDLESAFNELVNIPAAMTDAFLNGGQTLDITPLVSLVGVDLPVPVDIGVTFGGLLSPGGSIFNALNISVPLGPLPLPAPEIPGHGPGAIGSLIDLTKAIAKAIGWDGTGNPLEGATVPDATRTTSGDPGQPPASITASKPFTADLHVTSALNTDIGAEGGGAETDADRDAAAAEDAATASTGPETRESLQADPRETGMTGGTGDDGDGDTENPDTPVGDDSEDAADVGDAENTGDSVTVDHGDHRATDSNSNSGESADSDSAPGDDE